jgi:hypothetical protein
VRKVHGPGDLSFPPSATWGETAIVPLAAMLGFATEELAVRVGDAFGGLPKKETQKVTVGDWCEKCMAQETCRSRAFGQPLLLPY